MPHPSLARANLSKSKATHSASSASCDELSTSSADSVNAACMEGLATTAHAQHHSVHNHTTQSWLKRLLKWGLGGILATGLGAGACVALAVYWAAPDLSKFQLRSNVLYDKDSQIIYEMMTPDDYHRILTTPEQVDPLYLKMLLSSEDERFADHFGVDPLSIVRAAVGNVLAGKRVSGASTLAMQVCRLLEPKERTLFNKFKEALGAMYLTYTYGREQILTMYLTLAPFGGNIEGVTAASYSYFGHSPQKLTPAEAALLVALPRSPEKIRPDRHHLAALYYRNAVLTKAVTDGVIHPDVLDSAMQEGVPQYTRELPEIALHLGQSLFAGKLHPLLTDLVVSGQAAATPMDADFTPWNEAVYQMQLAASTTTSISTYTNTSTRSGSISHSSTSEELNAIKAKTDNSQSAPLTSTELLSSSALSDPSALSDYSAPTEQTDQYTFKSDTSNTLNAEHQSQDQLSVSPLNQPQSAAAIPELSPEYALRMRLRFDHQGRRLPTEIYTTIDPQVQQTLNEVIHGYRNGVLSEYPQENVAMLAVDNQSFEVLGYACSDQSYVDVIQATRSPGSALKPFAYALAFEQGLLHPNSVLLDLSRIYKTYQPHNYDRMFYGEITAAQALQGSLNLPALEIMRAIGPVNFVDHLNAYPNTITNRYLTAPQLEKISAPAPEQLSLDKMAVTPEAHAPQNEVASKTSMLPQSSLAAPEGATPASQITEGTQAPHLLAKPNTATQGQESMPAKHTSKHTLADPSFHNLASATVQTQLSQTPSNYIRGRIKLMPNTDPHLGVILGACGISLYDLTQLYAALAHDGQICPLQLLQRQQGTLSSHKTQGTHSTNTDLSFKPTQDFTAQLPQSSLESPTASSALEKEEQQQQHSALAAATPAQTGSLNSPRGNRSRLGTLESGEHNNLEFTKFLNQDTARITYELLEGLPVPHGFNFDREIKISYKTGTSFKYRDAIAVGSRGRYTIGVWQGRTDGSPSSLALSAYEKTAPLLFRALTLLPETRVFKPYLEPSGLLNPQPPQALEHLEIKTLGLTGLRRTNELGDKVSFTQSLPLEIVYPSDGMQIYAGGSGRILLQIQGGKPPYYVLINDVPQNEVAYFEPQHDGIYTITAIDSTGYSQMIQIWVQGASREASK